MIDHAGIRPLLLVRLRDVVDMQHRVSRAVDPRAGKIEWRPRATFHAEHVLVELHGLFEFAGRYIVMIEYADAHGHRASPWVSLGEYCEIGPLATHRRHE